MPRKDDFHDDHKELLVKTATTVELLNTRLFGADGQMGALPYILKQHEDMSAKLDKNKQELLDKIDLKKKEIDTDVDELRKDHNNLNIKVNWFAGGLTALGTAATMVMSWVGLHHKG